MRWNMRLNLFVAALSSITGAIPDTGPQQKVLSSPICQIHDDLLRQLSAGASISYDASTAPRWSALNAITPGAVVHVATEKDVQTTFQYALKHKLPFLAQAGTHGWCANLTLPQTGLLINLRGLNSVTLNAERTEARVGGGTLAQEVHAAAYAADAQVHSGACDCVGALGATLGGGFGHLAGLHGMMVDNLLSMEAVLANGSAVTVSRETDTDLWWAMRGAGPNFGVVTSARYKAYPTPKAENKATLTQLFFAPEKLETLIVAVEKLKLVPEAELSMALMANPAPGIAIQAFWYGAPDAARKFFNPLYEVGPASALAAESAYPEWNAGTAAICGKGLRRLGRGATFNKASPRTWRRIFNALQEFASHDGAGYSMVIMDAFPSTARFDDGSASFPHRGLRYYGFTMPAYDDPSLDAKALALGDFVREGLRKDGLKQGTTYINIGAGDEPNEMIYGASTKRLRALKKKYDPENVFNHWFNLKA